MVSVTENACRELKRILSEKVDWPGARLRLVDRGQGILGLGIDIELSGDQVVEYEGIRVLIVESELATKLKGITLDVDYKPDGAELVLSGKF
jgi:Fe-S cluster assembly iron-binding protein IscA